MLTEKKHFATKTALKW